MDSKIVIHGISGTGTLLSGAALCYCMFKGWFKKPYIVAYLNLAISDFLLSAEVFLNTLTCEPPVSHACEIFYYGLSRLLRNVNLLSILPLVVDRVIAVRFPLKYKNDSHKRINIILIVHCWLLSGIWLLTQYFFVMKPPLRYSQTDQKSLYITLMTEFMIFMMLPSLFNILSFIIVIAYIVNQPVMHHMNVIITVMKALLCVIVFSVSWIPMFVTYITEGYPRFMILHNLNTITDPFIFLIPNEYFKKIITRVRMIVPIDSRTSTKTTRLDMVTGSIVMSNAGASTFPNEFTVSNLRTTTPVEGSKTRKFLLRSIT